MTKVWILWVLVFADGEWRAWEHSYNRLEECLEVLKVITYRREHQLQAECRPGEK
jgi:hypothetical protein